MNWAAFLSVIALGFIVGACISLLRSYVRLSFVLLVMGFLAGALSAGLGL